MIVKTPPMGWNSWNTFGGNINEELIKTTADTMADSGLLDAGYEYLVIDYCWALRERDENGRMVSISYWVKHYEEESRFGIDNGRISKLMLKQDGRVVYNYDRVLDVPPQNEAAEMALAILMHEYN